MLYKILSMDGGGSWAVIQARVLRDIYGDITGHELLRQFDMVIANSGGSLVLAALCCNMSLQQIIDIFGEEEQRRQVFSRLTFSEELTNVFSLVEKVTGIGPKYDTGRKLDGLRRILTEGQNPPYHPKQYKPIVDRYLDELPEIIGKKSLQIIIVGLDYFRKRANFFRSNSSSQTNQFSKFIRITLAHAIHASSNAPVNYFKDPATVQLSQDDGLDDRTTWYWDGAVSGFNNPVLAGIIEATTNGVAQIDDYRVLSLGTGTGTKAILTDYQSSTNADIRAIYNANLDNPLAQTDNSFNFLLDVRDLATSVLSDPPDSATFMAYAILHPNLRKNANIVRINPCMKPEFNKLTKRYDYPAAYNTDDATQKQFLRLLKLDMDAVEQEEVDLILGLCDKFINGKRGGVANQLIRGQDEDNCLGHLHYSDAKAYWLKISS